MEKKVHKWCLQVDFESGEGPDLFPLGEDRDEDARNMRNFWGQLLLTEPPPKVSVVGLTKAEWEDAERLGRERA